jgi:hypothetical protein
MKKITMKDHEVFGFGEKESHIKKFRFSSRQIVFFSQFSSETCLHFSPNMIYSASTTWDKDTLETL